MSDNGENGKSIRASLGNLEVEVSGDDMEDVESVFNSVWTERLEESQEMQTALLSNIRSIE